MFSHVGGNYRNNVKIKISLKTKILYKATSSFDFLGSLLWRAACVLGIMYLVFHYQENPPVIIVAIIICLLMFIIIGNDEITVYSDKVIQTNTSILSLLLRSKGEVYEIKDIKAASLPENKLPNIFETGIILAVMAFLPKQPRRNNRRRICLDLKNGETVTIVSELGHNEVKEIVKTINSLI